MPAIFSSCRYVLGELILEDGRTATEAKLNTRVTQQAIHTTIKQLHGDFGIGAVTAGFVGKHSESWIVF